MKFNELNLTPDLMRGIEDADFTDCTPVQEQTFKLVLEEGRDATVQSQTGTGKTAAFLISIFEIFERASREPDGGKRHAALVVVPTRELAVQVADEAKVLGKHLSYRIGSVFGGVGYGQQERLLEKGADIIIGTPGRLLDFASSGKLNFKGFDFLVLDEADRMLDMGFLPDVRKILRALPPAGERSTLLFSATLSTRVKHLAWEHMRNPGEIEVAPEHVTVDEITQELYHVTRADKLRLLLGLLEREQPDNALIFTNMKSTAVELAKRLTKNGLPSEFIMGDLPQRKRLELIEGIKNGQIKLLVATDVAARGLHIDDLDLVINFDVPEDYELYVHRIGRTARAGKTGKAITLACERYVYGLEAIESYIGQKIPVVWPDEALFKDDASASMSFSERGRGGPPRRGERSGGGRTRSGQSRGPGGSSSGPRQRGGGRSGGPRTSAATGSRNGEQRDRQRPAPEAAASTGAKAPGGAKPSAPPKASAGPKPSADASLEDRLSYYRQKYGEDFQVTNGKSTGSERSRGSSGPQKERQPGRSGQGGRRGQDGRNAQSGGGNANRNRGAQRSDRGQNATAGRKPSPGKDASAAKNGAPRGRSGGPARNGDSAPRKPQPQRPAHAKGNGNGPAARQPAPPKPGAAVPPSPQDAGLVAKLKRLFKRQ